MITYFKMNNYGSANHNNPRIYHQHLFYGVGEQAHYLPSGQVLDYAHLTWIGTRHSYLWRGLDDLIRSGNKAPGNLSTLHL